MAYLLKIFKLGSNVAKSLPPLLEIAINSVPVQTAPEAKGRAEHYYVHSTLFGQGQREERNYNR